MCMRARRNFVRDFKISVLRELENDKTMAQVCRAHSIHPSMLSKWKQEYKGDPRTAFSGNGNVYKSEAKINEREQLIGQLYIENAFLKKVLSTLETKLAEFQKKG